MQGYIALAILRLAATPGQAEELLAVQGRSIALGGFGKLSESILIAAAPRIDRGQ
jgi:hypothetical protein